ncbi:MAG: haloacid dehalogenase-like hydrolase [Myxococcales bacterium]
MTCDKPTIVLFDIDGTLLLTGGAGRRAFERSFRSVIGRAESLAGFSFGGMTDRAIARMGLETAGLSADDERIEALLDAYVMALEDELAQRPNYRIMPHAREVVSAAREHPHVAVGLGTGNLKRGAEAKLRHGGLWELFDFGGFGCDHENRTELLRTGALRGAEKLGQPLSHCRIVVVGDTVRDVVAAHGILADCVGVETGGISAQELRAAGAHAVFPDLSAAGVLEAILQGGF